MATTDVATTSLNVRRVLLRGIAGCFTRDSWLSCGETWLTLAYKLFHRGGIGKVAKRGGTRKNNIGRARASASVQAAATRRQQNRHSKRCKKRETGVAA